MKNQKGFTLIEVVVYIALFAILMGGTIVTSYNIFESASRNQTKAVIQQEGGFLIGKIDWALSGAQGIVLPSTTTPSSDLQLTQYEGSNITISLNGQVMQIQKATGTYDLNTSNILVTNLVFTHTASSGDGITPESLTEQFTLASKTDDGRVVSQNFSLTKFLRK